MSFGFDTRWLENIEIIDQEFDVNVCLHTL